MATLRFYLDTRATGGDRSEKSAPLKLAVVHRGSTSYINLNLSLLPTQWNAKAEKVVKHPRQQSLNAMLKKHMISAEAAVISIGEQASLKAMSAKQLRDCILEAVQQEASKSASPTVKKVIEENSYTGPSFIDIFDENMNMKTPGNKRVIASTRSRLVAWLGEKNLARLKPEDVTLKWLHDFEEFLGKTCASANTIGLHLRNIRAAINYAIDCGHITQYVFRRVKIPKAPTKKRNLQIEALRKVIFTQGFDADLERYRDMFVLMFMMRGINFVDMCNLKEIEDGYIEYVRAKTHKVYRIKVEPEMQVLIDKYRGKHYLLNYLDNHKNYRSFYQMASRGLRSVKAKLDAVDDGITIKGLTTYWTRHSWATLAAELDIPFDTIMAGLGHGGNTVTDIYIERDPKKVDDAVRKVLDYVLYGKDYRTPGEVVEIATPQSVAKRKRGRPKKTP